MSSEISDSVLAQGFNLQELEHWVSKRESAEAMIEDVVAACRSAGCTWQQIADVLGVSKQAAWEKYFGTVSRAGA